MRRTRWVRRAEATLFCLLALAPAACASRTINQILADPYRYRNHEVRVSGSVAESYSFGNRGVYRLDDRTGQLWVVSDRGTPRKGARVSVTGTVRDAFNFGSLGDRVKLPPGIESGLVLIESSRRAED